MRAIALGLVLAAVTAKLAAATSVGGMVSTDTTWTLANGPYVVTSDITLGSGATLTIQPGVEVRFDPERRIKIDNGTFIARGTTGLPIRFTANATGNVQDEQRWNAIWFGDGTVDATYDGAGNYVSGSVVEHAIVEYAGRGEMLTSTWPSFYAYDGSAIYAGHASPYIAKGS